MHAASTQSGRLRRVRVPVRTRVRLCAAFMRKARRTAPTCACARAHACGPVCGVHTGSTANSSDVCVRVCSVCKRDDTGSQTSEKLYNGSAPHHQSWTQHMRRWARMRALLFKTGKPNGQTCACACKPSESTGGSTHVDGLRCVLHAHKHVWRTAQTCACPCEPLGTRRSTHTHTMRTTTTQFTNVVHQIPPKIHLKSAMNFRYKPTHAHNMPR